METPFSFSVRTKGLEPPRLTALDPKSSAATNYATRALLLVSGYKGKQKKMNHQTFDAILCDFVDKSGRFR